MPALAPPLLLLGPSSSPLCPALLPPPFLSSPFLLPLLDGITCGEPAYPCREASGCPRLPVLPEVCLILVFQTGCLSRVYRFQLRSEIGMAFKGFLWTLGDEEGK